MVSIGFPEATPHYRIVKFFSSCYLFEKAPQSPLDLDLHSELWVAVTTFSIYTSSRQDFCMPMFNQFKNQSSSITKINHHQSQKSNKSP
jgi:hypothetical protein